MSGVFLTSPIFVKRYNFKHPFSLESRRTIPTECNDLSSLEDMATIDLYAKYLELLKAYEAVVKQREDDRKAFDQQISAMRYQRALVVRLFSKP